MKLSHNDVEWVASGRHVYVKVRRWAGVLSVTATLLVGRWHKTWFWKSDRTVAGRG